MEFVMRWFHKEIFASKLYCKATGAPFPFEQVGDDGVIATDNPVYVNELDIAAAKHIGGVTSCTEQDYQEYKKKAQDKPSLRNLVGDRFSLSSLNLPRQSVGPVAVSGQPLHGQLPDTPKPEPIAIPTTFTRPKTSKGFLKKVDE